ncbi:MAG: Ig-like domain-containing protein [Ginsengibacter sp.]
MKNNSLIKEKGFLRMRKGSSHVFNKWFILFLLVAIAAGCKKVIEETGLTSVCPVVVSTIAVDGATDVDLHSTLSATFSKVMDSTSINGTTFTVKQGSTLIPGLVAYSAMTATFAPANTLIANTVYTGTITRGAKDPAGNALINDYTWEFTTGNPDVTAPKVILTDPANAATAVLLNKKITATFSEVMDSLSATSSFTIVNTTLGGTAVSGTVTYSGSSVVFSPATYLLPGTTYTGIIATGAKDLSNNALANNYVWSFTTGAPDVKAPTVISTDPVNGATDVALPKVVSANFSEVMDSSTISSSTFTVKNGNASIAGVVTYAGTKATFTPANDLLNNTTYTATVTTGAKDEAGNSLAADYVWSFATPVTDIRTPTVTSTDPVNGAIAVALNKKVSANFSESMDASTLTTTTFTLKKGSTLISGTVNYSGTKATFTPANDLLNNTTYTATVTTGAKDVAGNPLAANYVWSFTTLAVIPDIPTLGSASLFGTFGGSAGITNQGLNTVINNGSIGTTGASTLITGFHDGTSGDKYTETPLNEGDVKGRIYTAAPAPGTATSFTIATKGLADATIAYLSISPGAKPGGIDPGAGELGGLTLAPGIYKSASGTFKITNGNLTLDAKGDPNAVWIFQTAAGLTVGVAGPSGARSVSLINGGLAKNVFWYVGSAAVINGAGGGIMTGNIIASAGVTFSTAGNAVQTVLNGRALSLNASVTMVNTTINVPN